MLQLIVLQDAGLRISNELPAVSIYIIRYAMCKLRSYLHKIRFAHDLLGKKLLRKSGDVCRGKRKFERLLQKERL